VVDISDDGSRFAAQFADGSLGWFPAKYVRILEPRSQQQQQQQQRNTYQTNTQSYNTSVSTNNAYSKEHEAAKRQAQEKEKRRLELQKKLKQQNKRNEVDDDDIDNASKQLEGLKTYTETRGYLSNAPGFNRDLTQYIDDDDDQEANPAPVSPTTTKTNTTSSSGPYRKVEERNDGPKYVPSEDLPLQYKTGPWKCHSCHTSNGADRQKCNMCGTQRGEMSVSLDDVSTPGAEWNCSSCKVLNAPSRTTCIMCGTKYKPVTSPSAALKSQDPKTAKKTPAGNVKKKAIVTKAGSGVELQYAKGVDNHKNGGFVGHGADY